MRVGKAILTALWLSTTVTTVAATSLGQTPPQTPPSNDGNGMEATRHYEDGVAAAKLSQWAKAYESFRTAWKLKQHFQIAANLGRAELKLGKYRDAAEHLAYFLREASGVSLEERQAAQAMLDEARAKVGAVTILVDRADAEVLVDGVAVGKSPIGREVFVEPGRRTVEAKLGGFGEDRRSLDVTAGSSPKVLLTLSPSAGKQEDPGAQSPATPPIDSVAPGGPVEADSGGLSMPLIGAGIATSAVAAGAGVVLTFVSLSKASTRREECGETQTPSCSQERWDSLESARTLTANIAVWSFIGSGVVAAATVGYAIVGSSSKPKPASAITVQIQPYIGGLVVSGAW
jgi:hypothetical protein